MKLLSSLPWLMLVALTGLLARAEINIPSADGLDGDLILTNSGSPREVVIDLSIARDADWNSDDTNGLVLDPILGGPGIYDQHQWAVVFRYKTVRIERNVTVRFKNHDARAPVVWLVEGDVIIDGEVNLDGIHSEARTPEGGPGGFRGAYRPGGAHIYRGHLGVDGIRTSNNLIPLIGGAGSGATSGGGAIMISSKREVAINGRISLAGSGGREGNGVLKIIADRLVGNGNIVNDGAVRYELNTPPDHSITSVAPSYGPAEPVILWPDAEAPRVRLVSVEDADAHALGDPRASLGPEPFPSGRTFPADMTIKSNPTQNARIVIETINFPVAPESKVMLFATPNIGYIVGPPGNRTDYQPIQATFESGDSRRALWFVDIALPKGYTSLQVQAVGP